MAISRGFTFVANFAIHSTPGLKRSYDTIASFYDRLARLVYGNTLLRTQRYLLQYIPHNSRILIAGGGTGWILEEIARMHPAGLTITYIDSSPKMIALAEQRETGDNKVTFITAPVQNAILEGEVNVVITPFLLDNFTDDSLQTIFAKLDAALIPKGIWLYCDFQNTDVLWQKGVLQIMYLFFRTFCGVEARQLPDADGCFTKNGYTVRAEETFLSKFVVARVYEKR